jgi:hypothetical protein
MIENTTTMIDSVIATQGIGITVTDRGSKSRTIDQATHNSAGLNITIDRALFASKYAIVRELLLLVIAFRRRRNRLDPIEGTHTSR